MRLALPWLVIAGLGFSPTPLEAQRPETQASLGIHLGADVSDHHPLKLLGGQLAFNFAHGIRLQAIVTTVLEEPGTFVTMGVALHWHLPRGRVRPFLGGGAVLTYQDVGVLGQTDAGWLAQGGFEVPLRNLTPFAELRLIGRTSVATQILAGFKVEIGRYPT